MKFLFASDSFKGTLTSEQSMELLKKAASRVFPDCRAEGVTVADGGEGTVEAVVKATGGEICQVIVHGPLMEPEKSYFGKFHENCAVIEMAAASGLPMVPENKRNPLYTTTYGTGELINHALEQGIRKLSIAIGGSATNDGGMGAMRALGIRFLDKNGTELEGRGEDLEKVADIDISNLNPTVKEAEITVMCDVTNPLTGPDGATYTFGKQKGGTPEILDQLEKGMKNYANVVKDKLGIDIDRQQGAGAAGGLGAALYGFLGAQMKSGIETVLDLIEFDDLLEDTDLVITGEGRMDWQSAFGKVPSGVGMRCQKRNIPVIAIVGGLGKDFQTIYDFGINSIMPTVNGPMTLEEACDRTEELYLDAAERTFRMLKTGMQLKEKNDVS